MRAFLILAGLALPLAAASQEIYRWVDKDGVVHYEDQPNSPDAVLIDVIAPNEYESGDTASANYESTPDPQDEGAAGNYGSLSIISPSADQVFFGADAAVTVTASLDGELMSGHSLVFFVNGARRAAEGLSLALGNLPRGSYTVGATVLDENGRPVVSSEQTRFHVRQPSINSPQSPQAPRPRPRTQNPRTPPRT
jgi:hypothetical protein